MAATALWVQKRFGASLTRHNLYLFSVGRYGSLYALGILGTWIPLPVGLIVGAWHHLKPMRLTGSFLQLANVSPQGSSTEFKSQIAFLPPAGTSASLRCRC